MVEWKQQLVEPAADVFGAAAERGGIQISYCISMFVALTDSAITAYKLCSN
jgi:hypothetical protein